MKDCITAYKYTEADDYTSKPASTILFGQKFVELEQFDGQLVLILVVFKEMVQLFTQPVMEAWQHGRTSNNHYILC